MSASVPMPSIQVPARNLVWDFAYEIAQRPVYRHPGPVELANYLTVGRRARKLGQMFYPVNLTAESRVFREVVEYAGWLIYAVDFHGACFDDLLDGIDLFTATIVCAFSVDPRLDGTRRIQERLGRFAGTHAVCQLAKLSEITLRAEALKERMKPGMFEDRSAAKSWLDEQYHLAGAMSAIRDHPKLKKLIEATRRLLHQIDQVGVEY